MPRQVLGRGLESLIPTQSNSQNTKNSQPKNDSPDNTVSFVELSKIKPNPHQPRRNFDKEELADLAKSIKKHGVLQPLVVTEMENGYELIAGERRSKAAKMAGIKKIPVVIKQATEQDKLELAIIENVQRHDLNPVEEAQAYHKLVEEFKLTQEGVAMQVGKSRESIANTMRLLDLPAKMQKALVERKISMGHAKALLAVKSDRDRESLFKEILQGNITVRETEKRAKQKKEPVSEDKRNPYYLDLEDKLRTKLGAKVKVGSHKKGVRIAIDCYSTDEFKTVARSILGIDSE